MATEYQFPDTSDAETRSLWAFTLAALVAPVATQCAITFAIALPQLHIIFIPAFWGVLFFLGLMSLVLGAIGSAIFLGPALWFALHEKASKTGILLACCAAATAHSAVGLLIASKGHGLNGELLFLGFFYEVVTLGSSRFAIYGLIFVAKLLGALSAGFVFNALVPDPYENSTLLVVRTEPPAHNEAQAPQSHDLAGRR